MDFLSADTLRIHSCHAIHILSIRCLDLWPNFSYCLGDVIDYHIPGVVLLCYQSIWKTDWDWKNVKVFKNRYVAFNCWLSFCNAMAVHLISRLRLFVPFVFFCSAIAFWSYCERLFHFYWILNLGLSALRSR